MNRRGCLIKKPKLSFTAESRRQEALERQKQSRSEQLALVRHLKETCLEEEQEQAKQQQVFEDVQSDNFQDVALGKAVDMQNLHNKRIGRGQRYAGQLMLADWMLEIPHDLCQNWLVTARAEGQQCLVVGCRGRVITRLRSGRILHRLRGTPLNKISGCGLTLLDAVFNQENSTYYIMDVLCWKDYLMVECQAEFRVFWLQQQIAPEFAIQKDKGIQFMIAQYQAQDQVLQLMNFVEGSDRFIYDGFLFLHKQGHYQIHNEAPSPLALRWKDSTCSPYPIDTDKQGNVEQNQIISLKIGKDLSLHTIDEPAIVLGNVYQFQNYSNIVMSNLKIGKVVKSRLLTDLQIDENGQPCQFPKLEFVTISRGRPDAWSRILFQQYIRCQKNVTLQEIMDVQQMQMEH